MSETIPFCPNTDTATRNAAIFLSGSGSNAERILERLKQTPDSSLKVLALVTDRPKKSRAYELGKIYGIPVVAVDIRQFYRDRGQKRISIMTPEGRAIREEWTNELRAQLAPYSVDFGIFAGFVPLSNIAGDFPCLNVHPGDLTYEKDGARYLIGLHTFPIERAILEDIGYLRTSVVLVEPYEGSGDNMDAGPIMGVSPKVPTDLQGHSLDELKAIADARPEKRPIGGYKDILEEVAEHNQDLLKEGGDWVVFPPVVFEFAEGKYAYDEDGGLYFKESGEWTPVKTIEFGSDYHEIVP